MEVSPDYSYFLSLNKLYRDIVKEKINFTSLLGGQWDSLPEDEQNSLLDEHFIAPHIKQKYRQQQKQTKAQNEDVSDGIELEETTSTTGDCEDLLASMKIRAGQRIVEDDEGEMWQDEHSGPFSWETSSQSEFTMDFDNTESLKARIKDPKRPKSPRLMRSGSGDAIATRPGALERSGSTDFQQLRHIWENHLSTTPDSEMPPTLSSFLSKSQTSLNGEFIAYSRRMSASVNSIVEHEDEADEKPELDKAEPDSVKAKSDSVPPSTADTASAPEVSADSSEMTAPLAVKEEDEDIAGGMQDDIVKLSEIQTHMQEVLSKASVPEKTEPESKASAASSAKAEEKEDILAKYGVTFSYGDTSEQVEKKSNNDESAALPSSFDFLSSW